MGRRLCEMLAAAQLFAGKHCSFLQLLRENRILLLFLLLHIDGHKAVKFQLGGGEGKQISALLLSCGYADRGSLIYGGLHTAGGKPLPNQLVQTELISCQGFFHQNRSQGNICGTDCLVGVLNFSAALLGCLLCGHIGIPIGFPDKALAALSASSAIRVESVRR